MSLFCLLSGAGGIITMDKPALHLMEQRKSSTPTTRPTAASTSDQVFADTRWWRQGRPTRALSNQTARSLAGGPTIKERVPRPLCLSPRLSRSGNTSGQDSCKIQKNAKKRFLSWEKNLRRNIFGARGMPVD